ncbi:positive regulation of DNA demethylation [Homalodisca vitripennis]|nr:positive regulation of DNA demethylation [Homalodisca vitripennis]
MDGDIIVFQKKPRENRRHLPNATEPEVSTCREYFRDLFYRVEVTFCDKMIPNDPGFTMELSTRMNYQQLGSAVAQRVGTDPARLQFFKTQTYKDSPGNALRCTFEGTLKDLLVFSKPKGVKKIYYQQLSIPVFEFENKRTFKCFWVGPKMKEEKELTLYPNKNASVAELLEEAKKVVELSPDGSGKLRLVEINSNKINLGPKEDALLETLVGAQNTTKMYRIEEIPKDELEIAEDESLIPVAHFYKDIFSTFGIPFLIKVKHKKAIRVLADLEPRQSCRHAFQALQIMTYCAIHPRSYHKNLKTGKDLHHYNTRYATSYTLPIHRTALFEEKPTYIGRKLWNHLPQPLTELQGNAFKKALHDLLVGQPFYTIDEFLNQDWRPSTGTQQSLSNGEPFSDVKERIAKKLGIQDKEFEKFKFAIISLGRAQFINEENEGYSINLQDFRPHYGQGSIDYSTIS